MHFSQNSLQSTLERTNWIVTHLPKLPDNYTLSTSSFEVSNQKVYTIASRIFTCNKVRSVHAVYDDDGAIANCKTPSSTKLDIRLFQAPEHTSNVLVEIRRKAGCSLDFQQEYRALFQAATYGEAYPREYPLHKKATCIVDKGHTGEGYIPLPKGIIERSLEMAQDHLRLEHYDAQMLVLTDLALTTDPYSTETASTATKLIFQEYTGILEFMIKVITQKMLVNDDDDDDERNEHMRSSSLTLLRNLLTVSLQDTDGNGDLTLQGVSLINDAFSKEALVQSLLQDVKEARDYPWNACLASKYLALLVANFVDIKIQVRGDRNAFDALNDARIFGNASHSYLKQEVDDMYGVCYGEQKED